MGVELIGESKELLQNVSNKSTSNNTIIEDSNDILKNSLNEGGSETITDTQAHTGTFYWISVIEAATISAITLEAEESGNTLVGVELPAGFQNPLLCSSITLSAGKVRMAKKVV
jgi:hypothetical protein